MSALHEFLNKTGIFFLASEDGDQPKVRPLGAHVEANGHEYFTIGDFKEVYRQLSINPKTEITAFDPQERKWLRYTGTAEFVDDPQITETILNQLPHLRNVYNEQTGHRMKIFYLKDATAFIIDMAGNRETLEV